MVDALTPDEIQFFRHAGYLKLPSRLPDAHVDRVRRLVLDHLAREVQPVNYDGEGRPVRLSQVLDRDPVFKETASHPSVIGPLTQLIGPNIVALKNRHNHATLNPASAKRDSFHRDVAHWTRGLLTVIFYLERTTVENGCTCVVPGSHTLPSVSGGLHGLNAQPDVAATRLLNQAVPVPLSAGSMLAIDSLIYHCIGENTTDETRMSMTIGYQTVDELASVDDPTRLLIQGERIYQGNDRKRG